MISEIFPSITPLTISAEMSSSHPQSRIPTRTYSTYTTDRPFVHPPRSILSAVYVGQQQQQQKRHRRQKPHDDDREIFSTAVPVSSDAVFVDNVNIAMPKDILMTKPTPLQTIKGDGKECLNRAIKCDASRGL